MRSSTTNESLDELIQLSKLMRRWILTSTTTAGSGHPTSSLSAVELMSALYFGGIFRYDVKHPENARNDRLIFSKGHASPLLYALWTAAGQLTPDELIHYREFDSPLEGHATSRFRFTEAATGSLGQGLSIGVGMALNAKLDRLPYRTFVLLGDSEMTEGSQWEAIQLAEHYQLNNLIGILDVNRLGQRGPTLYGNDLEAYQRRIAAFGWRTIVVKDGHDLARLLDAYNEACTATDAPTMLIANTIKGKGVSALEDQDGWHGKPLDEDQLAEALNELGATDESLRGNITKPASTSATKSESVSGTAKVAPSDQQSGYSLGDEVATREAFGQAMKRLGDIFSNLISLDGEVSNSTKAEIFAEAFPDRFFEMYIAEQNMVGIATGLTLRGKLPVVSSFAAFLTRAFDQIRMSVYSGANVKLVGSHCGVSIGQDGPSQMGLEDIAMFRSIYGSVVLYPCDAVATDRLLEAMLAHEGLVYLRTTREATSVIYEKQAEFRIGGSHTLRQSADDEVTIVAAGITVHEALKAYDRLQQASISARIIDLYSIKPLDVKVIDQAAAETGAIIVVEDHFAEGGIGEAVRSSLEQNLVPVHHLAVRQRPRSGSPERLREHQAIDADAITKLVQEIVRSKVATR